MISLQVELRYHPQRQRATAALLLQGADPVVWLDEFERAGLSMDDVTLLILPASRSDLSPSGVLILLPDGSEPPTAGFGVHYGRVGQKLLVPVNAQLSPAVADDEWDALLPTDRVISVWHPRMGIIGFDQQDLLRASAFVRVPQLQAADWSAAQPGTAFPSRIISLKAPVPETPEQILLSGADGIGSKSKEISKLQGGWKKAVQGISDTGGRLIDVPFAMLAKMIAAVAPPTAARPTWINKISDWADKVFQASHQQLRERSREVQRLMKMLNDEPDEGLQYAIPIGGRATGQAAPPRSQLTKRPSIFDLSRLLGSGEATDYWDIPPEDQHKLLQRYRELAEREIGLGRPRRAAYIYAELVGDFTSAAVTLKNASQYRDAAALYRDKLNRPLEAAQCLEQGGLPYEAIPIYEQLRKYDSVGHLYEVLQETERSQAAYRRHVSECLVKGEHLAAAETLEHQLHDVEKALEVLEENWSFSIQKRACLDKSFEILGRYGRHDEAASRIEKLKAATFPKSTSLELVEALAGAAKTYPQQLICRQAADATRVLVSRSLEKGGNANKGMLQVLEKLTPQDLLLSRDTARFQLSSKRPVRKKQRGRPSRPIGHWNAELKATYRLPVEFSWECFTAYQESLFALGTSKGEAVRLSVMTWDQSLPFVHTDWTGLSLRNRWPSMCVQEVPPGIWISCGNSDLTTMKSVLLPGGTGQVIAGTPPWIGDETSGLSSCFGMVWIVELPSLMIKACAPDGTALIYRQLTLAPGESISADDRVPLHARREAAYVGLGSSLIQISNTDSVRRIQLDSQIRELAGSFPMTLPRVAVFYDRGGAVVWPRVGGEDIFSLPDDLEQPGGVFLRDGHLVVHATDGWRIYATSKRHCELLGEIKGINHEPLEILARPSTNQIAVCTAAGEVAIYALER